MHTPDITESNIDKIGQLFQNCLTERIGEDGKVERVIDFDQLRQELSKEIVEGPQERYQFTWPDKKKAIRLANTPSTMTLRPCREESVDFNNTENLYIEGDNLDVLKLLREDYLGKVKMIYIDPPYNTGNDFIYEDDFSQSVESFINKSGQVDEQGNRLVQNTESNGRFHSDWLNMIYPRLRIAKDLLTDDGIIFISIDENEVGNLQKVCDEVFGEANFVSQLIWAAGRKNDSKYISVSHEYILCYVKNMQYLKDNKITWREKKQGLQDIYAAYDLFRKQFGGDNDAVENALKKWFKNLPDGHPAKDHSHYNRIDDRGIYFASDISWPGGGGPKYTVLHPVTGHPVRIPSRGWITNEVTLKQWISEDRVDFGPNESYVPTLKSYLKDKEYSVPYSVFYKDGRAASKRLATLMGDKVFENPKDEEIISRLVDFTTGEGDLILDFFSGSGTTAHGIFLRSAADNKRRRFILVQLPEIIDPSKEPAGKARKVAENAVALLDSIGVSHNICEIGKERIRRAGKKVLEDLSVEDSDGGLFTNKESKTIIDVGFRVLKLDSSNMNDVYYRPEEFSEQLIKEDNVKDDRSPEDLLFQVMLECNLPLSAKIQTEKIAGKDVFTVNNGYLIACFDENVNEEVITAVAKRKPYYFVMRDSSLSSDNVADNFEQIFQAYSKDTIRRIL